MSWYRITETSNIPVREGRRVTLGGREIAIFNLGDRFAAIDNTCPHSGGPMCDGIVSGPAVICPLHGWKICLDTGAVLKPEVAARIATYPVSVDQGIISVQLPERGRKERAA